MWQLTVAPFLPPAPKPPSSSPAKDGTRKSKCKGVKTKQDSYSEHSRYGTKEGWFGGIGIQTERDLFLGNREEVGSLVGVGWNSRCVNHSLIFGLYKRFPLQRFEMRSTKLLM